MALLRTAVTHETAAERMRGIFASQLVPTVARLSGESRTRVATRAGLISTQMLGLALCRYVLRLPPVVGIKRAELVRRVGPTIQRLPVRRLSRARFPVSQRAQASEGAEMLPEGGWAHVRAIRQVVPMERLNEVLLEPGDGLRDLPARGPRGDEAPELWPCGPVSRRMVISC